MLALRVAYYAAVALADEVRTLPSLDAYDRLTARNGVQAARVALDEDNFLRAAIAVDADDEGRWSSPATLPAVVEFTAAAPPVALDDVLAPACRALFAGKPSELGLALSLSPRLRSGFTRPLAQAMFAARRAGDAVAAQRAAAATLRALEGGA
jgi:hypothetical protein